MSENIPSPETNVTDENTGENIQAPPVTSIPLTSTGQKPNDNQTIFVERPEDDIFIVELAAGPKIVLDPGLTVYLDNDDILIPLGKIAAALSFPIEVDTANASAQGWFINEKSTFNLSAPFTSVNIAGEIYPVAGKVENHIDDIYVSLREMEKWFPISLEMKFNELRLYLSSTVDLPFQEQAIREERWKRLSARTTREKENYDDVIFLPYKTFSPPSVQFSHSIDHNRSPGTTLSTMTSNVQASGDLLGHSMRLTGAYNALDSTNKGLNNVLFTLSKDDFRGNLLGPLKATSYELGDVSTSPFPLADNPSRGRGISVSNAPANFVRDASDFAIRGEGPIGWDVEVYQDEQILEYAKIGNDGRYDFEGLNLREGFNLFRIMLYGPNGEKEERFEQYYLGQGMLAPGEFIYDVSAIQSTEPLLNVDDRPATPQSLSAMFERGLTKNLSAYAGLVKTPLGNEKTDALGAGLRISSSRFYTQVSTIANTDGGKSASVTTTGNLGKTTTVGAGHTENSGYDTGQKNNQRETYIRFSQMFSFKLFQFGSYSLEGKRSISDSNIETRTISARVAGSFFGLSLSNDIERSKIYTSNAQATIDGDLTLRYRAPIGLLRGRLGYALDGRDLLQNGELKLQTQLSESTFLNLGFTRQFSGTRRSVYSASLDRQFDKFRLGVNGAYGTDNDIRVGMSLAYNIVPDGHGGYYLTGSPKAIGSGSLEIAPFLDANQDGIYNEGEQLIENVSIRGMQRNTKGLSLADSGAVVDGINVGAINKITVDVKTLPDIYMVPSVENIRVFGKQGFNGPIYYPISLLGEIGGTLQRYSEDGSEPEPLAGVRLVLLDEKDEVAAETFSEYDGYFSFQSLKLGTYKIFIPPQPQMADWLGIDPTSIPLTLRADETEMSSLDLLLSKDGIKMQ